MIRSKLSLNMFYSLLCIFNNNRRVIMLLLIIRCGTRRAGLLLAAVRYGTVRYVIVPAVPYGNRLEPQLTDHNEVLLACGSLGDPSWRRRWEVRRGRPDCSANSGIPCPPTSGNTGRDWNSSTTSQAVGAPSGSEAAMSLRLLGCWVAALRMEQAWTTPQTPEIL